MKVYEDRQTTYRQLVDLKCDLCGESVYSECDEFECTISMKDRPFGEEREFDICRQCWGTRLLYWLSNQGVTTSGRVD